MELSIFPEILAFWQDFWYAYPRKKVSPVNAVIIACRTLEAELNTAISSCRCTYPVIWLEAGDHNVPQRRREAVISALKHCGSYDTVLLAMSLCGGALENIESKDKKLVLPRCDDCLTILLGSRDSRRKYRDLYLLTKGWLDGRGSILAEYDHCLHNYGENRTRRIFAEMFRHYRGIGLISLDEEPQPEVYARASDFAGKVGLPLVRISGSADYLQELLVGSWDSEKFLVIRPGEKIERKCPGGETYA